MLTPRALCPLTYRLHGEAYSWAGGASAAGVVVTGAAWVSVVASSVSSRHILKPSVCVMKCQRRLLIGRTDGGRALTLVIEQTIDPTTWLIVTGWIPHPASVNCSGAEHGPRPLDRF
jgi:hypothetical protein